MMKSDDIAMKMSFVIPAHNEEACIGKCLDSVFKELRASPCDAEVVVVNNASTDATEDIAGEYPSVKIVCEPQKGAARARSAGFLAASGELVANIDADTMLPPGWIAKALEEFSLNEKLVALSGPVIYYDLPKSVNFFIETFFYPISFAAYLINKIFLKSGALIQGGNCVLKRKALEDIGGYNTKIDFYGDDVDLARRIGKAGLVKFTYGLPIYTSGRRLAKEGAFTMGVRYGANYLSMMIFHRPITTKALDIRAAGGENRYNPDKKLREYAAAGATISVLAFMLFGAGWLLYGIVKSGFWNGFPAGIKTDAEVIGAAVSAISLQAEENTGIKPAAGISR